MREDITGQFDAHYDASDPAWYGDVESVVVVPALGTNDDYRLIYLDTSGDVVEVKQRREEQVANHVAGGYYTHYGDD
jgi:hypothetical protein